VLSRACIYDPPRSNLAVDYSEAQIEIVEYSEASVCAANPIRPPPSQTCLPALCGPGAGGITMVVAEVVVAALIAVEFRDATGDAAMPKAAAVCVLFFTCLFVSGFAWSWVRSPEGVS